MLQRVWLVCWMLVLKFCIVVVGHVGDCGADPDLLWICTAVSFRNCPKRNASCTNVAELIVKVDVGCAGVVR